MYTLHCPEVMEYGVDRAPDAPRLCMAIVLLTRCRYRVGLEEVTAAQNHVLCRPTFLGRDARDGAERAK